MSACCRASPSRAASGPGSTTSCSSAGSAATQLVGLDAAELRPQDALVAREIDGARWHRCLRCDSWLPFSPPAEPATRHLPPLDEIELPLRGKPLRDKIVLRAIAIDRALHFVVLAALAVGVFLVASQRDRPARQVLRRARRPARRPRRADQRLGGGFVDRIDDFLNLPPDKLQLIGARARRLRGPAARRGGRLWLQKRWAEYLTFISTSALLPLEIYELIERVTVAQGHRDDRQPRDRRLPAVRQAPLRPARRQRPTRPCASATSAGARWPRARPRLPRGALDAATAGPDRSDLGDVAVVGAAAAAEHVQLRQLLGSAA